jgi:hypothetical protein
MLGVNLVCTGMLGWCRTDTSHLLISYCPKFVIFVSILEIIYTIWSNISSRPSSSNRSSGEVTVVQAAAGLEISNAVVTEQC